MTKLDVEKHVTLGYRIVDIMLELRELKKGSDYGVSAVSITGSPHTGSNCSPVELQVLNNQRRIELKTKQVQQLIDKFNLTEQRIRESGLKRTDWLTLLISYSDIAPDKQLAELFRTTPAGLKSKRNRILGKLKTV